MKDDGKKKYINILWMSLLIIALLPFLIVHLIFRNEIYSSLSNGEWGRILRKLPGRHN